MQTDVCVLAQTVKREKCRPRVLVRNDTRVYDFDRYDRNSAMLFSMWMNAYSLDLHVT